MNLIKKISSHLRNNPLVNNNCTEFEVDNYILSKYIVNHLIPIVDLHPFPINELHLMTASVCRIRPTHIFEWGTHIGKSARIFYETVRYFNIETEIHSVDLPPHEKHKEHPGKKRGSLVQNLKNVHLHLGDGLNVSISLYRSLPSDTIPLFYVDGDHSYSSVKRELGTIAEEATNASILLHDTFYQSPESKYNIGPHQAIQEVLADFTGRYAVIQCATGLPGMTLLYRRLPE